MTGSQPDLEARSAYLPVRPLHTSPCIPPLQLQSGFAKLASVLSYGDQRKLEIAIALAASPRLLLIDEPTAGMSPAETAEMVQVRAALPRDIALVIVEHDMDVVSALAERVTVLQNGRVIAEGSWTEIRENESVQRAYMGARRRH